MLSINNTINNIINNRMETLTSSSVSNKSFFFINFSKSFLDLLTINTRYFSNVNDNNKHILLNYLLKDISFDIPKIYYPITPTYLKKSLSVVYNVIEPFTIVVSFYDTPDL